MNKHTCEQEGLCRNHPLIMPETRISDDRVVSYMYKIPALVVYSTKQ